MGDLLSFAEKYATQHLREMINLTLPHNLWHLFAYERQFQSHQGVNTILAKSLRKRLLQDRGLKKKMQKKGIPDAGDMLIQTFMIKRNTLAISTTFAETDSLGREQPLH